MNELTTLRRRHQALVDSLPDPPDFSAGTRSALVQTTTETTYPTAASAYYSVVRVTPGGVETEGAAPTFAPVGAAFKAMNLGSAVPPSGTMILAVLLSGRYVFRYDG